MYRVEDCPQIQGSWFLGGRCEGASKILRGSVGVLTYFLTRGEGSWSKQDRDKYYEILNKAESFLMREAKRYGAPLEFVNYHYIGNLPSDANHLHTFSHVKKFLNVASMEDAQNYFERTLCCSEVPLIFVFNEPGQCFAWTQGKGGTVDESSTVFFDGGNLHWYLIAHELLHQFGAPDYYKPEAIRVKALQYFGNSVMGVGDYTAAVDDLSAYLVGWKDTLSEYSYCFLKDTMWYCKDK